MWSRTGEMVTARNSISSKSVDPKMNYPRIKNLQIKVHINKKEKKNISSRKKDTR